MIDFYLHMNNSYYFTAMESARIDYLIRTGLIDTLFNSKQRYAANLGGTSYQFRRDLSPFSMYTVKTRLSCVDDKASRMNWLI